MKILHVVHQFAPHFVGGTELYTAGLVAEQVKLNHKVGIFVPTPERPSQDTAVVQSDLNGATLFQVSVGPRSGAQVFKDTLASSGPIADGFQQVLADFRPDVVHIQHLMGLPVRAIDGALKASQINFVVTLHDFWWVCANAQRLTNYDQTLCAGPGWGHLNCGRCAAARGGRSGGMAPAFSPLMGWRNRMLRPLLQRADAVFAATRFVADWHQQQVQFNQKIEVVPLGIDLDQFAAVQVDKPNLDKNGLNLLYVGGLSPQKGVHVIVDAVGRLGNEIQLNIMGDETKFTDYVAALKENAPPNIRFMGKRSAPEIAQAMASADMLLIPALWYETFALVLSEAFALKLPVMVSDIGAMAERVTDGINGIKVKPGDVAAWAEAIQAVAADKSILQKLAKGIPSGVSMHEHANIIDRHLVNLATK